MKNAVIYARYSSDGQREESIEDQIRECEIYAKQHDYHIVDRYHDNALTGRTEKRPSFQQMIKDSKSDVFDYIICYKTDRFFRNRYESQKYKKILNDNGVKVVYAKMEIPKGPEGIILEGMMEALDEYYSANLAQNVKRGLDGNAAKCRTNGVVVFGYERDDNDKYIINEREANAVNKVYDMVIDRCSNVDILAWLKVNGYTNSRGRDFSKDAIHRMIVNRKYIGEYRYGDHVIPGGMPAIVSEEKFLKANEVIGMKCEKRSKNNDYLLSRILYCGECGSSMFGVSGTSASGGKKYYYYACSNNRHHKGCNKTNVDKTTLENVIINIINEYIFNDDTLNDIIDGIMQYQEENIDNSQIEIFKQQLKETDKGINNIVSAIEKGMFNESLISRMKELENKKADLENKIKLEESNNKLLSRDLIEFAIYRMKVDNDSNDQNKRRLIETFISKAFLFNDGKLALTFNYRRNGHLATHEEILDILKSNKEVRTLSFGAAKEKQIELCFTNDNVFIIIDLN